FCFQPARLCQPISSCDGAVRLRQGLRKTGPLLVVCFVPMAKSPGHAESEGQNDWHWWCRAKPSPQGVGFETKALRTPAPDRIHPQKSATAARSGLAECSLSRFPEQPRTHEELKGGAYDDFKSND